MEYTALFKHLSKKYQRKKSSKQKEGSHIECYIVPSIIELYILAKRSYINYYYTKSAISASALMTVSKYSGHYCFALAHVAE